MPSQWGPILLCGWPGLAGLWFRGNVASLLVAVGFSVLLNLALVTSFLWPWSLGEMFPLVAWPIIFMVWTVSAIVAYQRLPDLMAVPTSEKVADQRPPDTLFIQAQVEYLRGHWQESASLLHQQIGRVPRDIESRLLLATLKRHMRNFEDARQQLDEIEKFDESLEWVFEMARERDLLDLIQQHENSEASVEATSDTFNEVSNQAQSTS
ncbi:MAG: hypothetical protein AAFN77_07285 [Planctomycetota bacterium]